MTTKARRTRRRATAEGKVKTEGVDPKVPVQAVVTIIVAAAAYFGVDLDAEVSAAIAVVLGAVAGVLAPAPRTRLEVPATMESGSSHMRS